MVGLCASLYMSCFVLQLHIAWGDWHHGNSQIEKKPTHTTSMKKKKYEKNWLGERRVPNMLESRIIHIETLGLSSMATSKYVNGVISENVRFAIHLNGTYNQHTYTHTYSLTLILAQTIHSQFLFVFSSDVYVCVGVWVSHLSRLLVRMMFRVAVFHLLPC